MQSIDGVCRLYIGMGGEAAACVCMCMCVRNGSRVFNTLRGREASSRESNLNVFYLPPFRGADQK